MNRSLLLILPLCVSVNTLAINPGEPLQITDSIQTLSKRQTEFVGNFPALGGSEKAGKVFTTTASAVTQSDNLITGARRSALQFEEDNGERLKANPEKLQSNVALGRKLNLETSPNSLNTSPELTSAEEEGSKLFKSVEDFDAQSKKEGTEASNAEAAAKESQDNDINNEKIENPKPLKRKLSRRNLNELNDSFEVIQTESADEESWGLMLQRYLGLFPTLGGVEGTVSAKEAEMTVLERVANISPEVSRIITEGPNAVIIPLYASNSGNPIQPPCEHVSPLLE